MNMTKISSVLNDMLRRGPASIRQVGEELLRLGVEPVAKGIQPTRSLGTLCDNVHVCVGILEEKGVIAPDNLTNEQGAAIEKITRGDDDEESWAAFDSVTWKLRVAAPVLIGNVDI